MFPGLGGGMNPKKMQGLMKQLGIAQEEVHAESVVINKTDGSKIIIENPQVSKVKMQGHETFQVAGEVKEEAGEAFTEADIKLVAEKTSKTEAEAKSALEETNGDIAEAIMKLSE